MKVFVKVLNLNNSTAFVKTVYSNSLCREFLRKTTKGKISNLPKNVSKTLKLLVSKHELCSAETI